MGNMTKTPEQMAAEHVKKVWRDSGTEFDRMACEWDFLAGYKAGFQIGCMKGSMAMQWTLDDDYHFTPTIDHEKLAKVMTKKEIENE